MHPPNPAPCVVITGGSRGIGWALARRFAEAGHNVFLIARNRDALARAASRLQGDYPKIRVGWGPIDVTEPTALDAIKSALAAESFYAEILINNAAIGLSGPFASHGRDELARLLDLNILALTRLTHGFLPEMQSRKAGAIISMASMGGYVPGPYQAVYYASKAYVLSLSEALAAELSGSGIRVLAIAPGPVPTGFHASMGADAARYRSFIPHQSPEFVARSTYRAFRMGRRVAVPGVLNQLMAYALKLIPHFIAVPLMAWLLHRDAKN